MLILQSQWPLQQALSLDPGWQGQVMGQSRRLLADDIVAPASVKGGLQALPNQSRPDWIRWELLAHLWLQFYKPILFPVSCCILLMRHAIAPGPSSAIANMQS